MVNCVDIIGIRRVKRVSGTLSVQSISFSKSHYSVHLKKLVTNP